MHTGRTGSTDGCDVNGDKVGSPIEGALVGRLTLGEDVSGCWVGAELMGLLEGPLLDGDVLGAEVRGEWEG